MSSFPSLSPAVAQSPYLSLSPAVAEALIVSPAVGYAAIVLHADAAVPLDQCNSVDE